MQLILLRHGIATEREAKAGPPDPERPLTDKGARRVRAAAEGLDALGVAPDLLLCSPYLRARQTADLVAEVLGVPAARRRTVDCLEPEEPPRELLAALRKYNAACVIAVGHAPHLDEVVAVALGGGRAPFTALKKAGAACLELGEGEGGAAGGGGARLVWLLEPSMLRALAG